MKWYEIYKQMLRISDQRRLPTFNRASLTTWDRLVLIKWGDDVPEFAWVLHWSGTFIIKPPFTESPWRERVHIFIKVQMMNEHQPGIPKFMGERYAFWFNGERLQEVSMKGLLGMLNRKLLETYSYEDYLDTFRRLRKHKRPLTKNKFREVLETLAATSFALSISESKAEEKKLHQQVVQLEKALLLVEPEILEF